MLTATRPGIRGGGHVTTPPAFVNASAHTDTGSSANTSLNITLPTGIQAGDLIFVLAYRWTPTSHPGTPAGFTAASSGAAGPGPDSYDLFTKTAAGSESGTTVTVTWGNAVESALLCGIYRGCSATPVEAVTAGNAGNGGATTQTLAALTAAAGRTLIRGVFPNSGNGDPVVTPAAPLNSRVSHRVQFRNLEANLSDRQIPGAGTTGTDTVTYALGTSLGGTVSFLIAGA